MENPFWEQIASRAHAEYTESGGLLDYPEWLTAGCPTYAAEQREQTLWELLRGFDDVRDSFRQDAGQRRP